MTTLTELLEKKDINTLQAEFFAEMITLHRANGVPVDAWLSPRNTGLSQTQINALLFASDRQGITLFARAMFLQYASGVGLTLYAKSQYDVARAAAQITKGNVRLISVAGAPLYNIAPGDITVGTQGPTANQKLYTNVTGSTLAPNSTLDLVFAAVASGSTYNIPNNTPLDLKTSLAGVTVSNPIYPPAATWITQLGTDEESDEQLRKRCLAKWSIIGAECSNEAMLYYAYLPPPGYVASPVTQARVLRNFIISNLYTGYWPGGVTIVVGNDFGGLAPADLAAVRSNFENPQKYGIGRNLTVINLSLVNVNVSANVFVYRSSLLTDAEIYNEVISSLVNFQSFIQIGDEVFPQKIGARIEDGNKTDIRNVQMITPSSVFVPQYYERANLVPTAINIFRVDR